MTKMNSSTGAQMLFRPAKRSRHGIGVPLGRKSGLNQPISAMVSMYMVIASRPGMMPAMNSFPMSCSVMMP